MLSIAWLGTDEHTNSDQGLTYLPALQLPVKTVFAKDTVSSWSYSPGKHERPQGPPPVLAEITRRIDHLNR